MRIVTFDEFKQKVSALPENQGATELQIYNAWDETFGKPQRQAMAEADGPVAYSVDQAQKLMGAGLRTFGEGLGSERLENFGQGVVDQQDQDIEAGNYQPQYQGSFRDNLSEGGIKQGAGWAFEKALENVAYSGGAIAGGALAAIAAPFSVPLSLLIGGVTIAGSGLGITGETALEMEEKGVDVNPGLAIGAGVIGGTLERFGLGRLFPSSKLAGMTGKELVTELAEKGHKDAAKIIAKEIVKRSSAEIGAEVGQEGTIVGASALAGAEYEADELIDRAIDTMVVAGTLTTPYSVTGTIRDSMGPAPEATPDKPKTLEELRQEQLLIEESLVAQAETAEQQVVEAVAAQGGDALDAEFAKSEVRREYSTDISATAKALRETNQLAQTETEKALQARDELLSDIDTPVTAQTEPVVATQPVERTELFARPVEQTVTAEIIEAPATSQTNQPTTLQTNQETGIVLQNRDRKTQASIDQMTNIAANPDYGRLGFSRDFGNGAPVIEPGATLDESNLGKADYAVTGEGRRIPVQYAVVEADQLLPSNRSDGSTNADYETGSEGKSRAIAGNGRVAGLQSAFTKGTAEQYKQSLIDDAELTGINPQIVQSMQKPVLVRVMPKEEITSNIGDESNTSGVSQLSPSEQARNDAQRVDAAQIPVSDEGVVTRQAAQAFIATMPQSERGSLMDGSEPNRKAYERLENLIFSEAFESPELLRLQADATDTEVKNIMAGLRVAAAKLARLKGAGDLDVRDLVREAAEVAVNAKRSGQKLADYIQQSDMQQNPEIMPILRMMVENSRSAKKIGQSLSDMADMFYAESRRGGTDMFGNVEQRNRQQLMGESFDGEQAGTEDIGQQGRSGIDDASTERGAEAEQTENTRSEDGAQSDPQPSEELTLQPQTQAEIEQQQAEQAKAQQEAAEAERKASEREQVDKDRNDFDLTGSDSKRDVMAAQGQNELDIAGQSSTNQAAQPTESKAETTDNLPDIKPEIETESRTSQSSTPIEDFGEKILGARKDFASKMADAKEKDIAAVPLSESWPEPDYQNLVDNGADKMAVGFARALREEIPSKPRVSWKLKGWSETVENSRDIAERIVAGEIDVAELRQKFSTSGIRASARMAEYVFGRAELYAEFGHEKSLKGLKFYKAHYAVLKVDEGFEKDVAKWVIERPSGASNSFSNMPYNLASAETKEAALDQFRKIYSELGQKKEAKAVRFDIYTSRRDKEDVFIGKKIGRDVVRIQDGFKTVNEARLYRTENQEALEKKLERMKDVPDMRKETNAPRVGIDHRNGGDVTPEQFSEGFGFRGVQFGNYVEQGKRQQDLNDAYDALMDLAGILNIPPKALSLNGELGLAFGARGKGGKRPAKAHYERGNVVINLTKKSGAGSLAHEWWHSLDNYFSRQGGGDGFVTDNPYRKLDGVRPEVITAFKEVNAAINRTKLRQRSEKLDATRTKPYWGTNLEMSARSFESYTIEKLNDQGASSDYLANIVSEDYWNAAANLGIEKDGTYPYPEAAEVPEIRAAFDNFFEVVETKETDQGVALYSQGDGDGLSLTDAETILNQDKRLARAVSKGKLKVVQSGSDIPESANRYGSDDAIQGAYLNGTAYIVADGNGEQSIVSTAWHELTHATMDTQGDTFITPEVKQKLFNRLSNQVKLARNSKKDSPLKRAIARAENAGTADAKFLEEVAGYLVTDYVNQSDSLTGSIRQWVQDLIAAIQSAVLRFSGIQVGSVTGTELNAIAKAYADYVTLSDRGRGEQVVDSVIAEDSDNILYSKSAAENVYDRAFESLGDKDKTVFNKMKSVLKRELLPGGLLPDSVFKAKIQRDSEMNGMEFDIANRTSRLDRAVQRVYGKPYKDVGPNELLKINEALGSPEPDMSLDESIRQEIYAMRNLIRGMSQKYANQLQREIDTLRADGSNAAAESKAQLLETIMNNLDTYVHRSYRAFDDPNWPKRVSREVYDAAAGYLEKQYAGKGDVTAAIQDKAAKTIELMLEDGTAFDSMEAFIKESKLGAKDLSILQRRKQIAPEIRELLGEYKDPKVNFTKSVTKMTRLVFNQTFLDQIREIGLRDGFLFDKESRPLDATKMIAADSSETYAPLNGLYTFPEIDQAFKDALGKEEMAGWFRAIVRANGMVKFGKTVLSPTTAARNWMSAMFFALANGHFDFTQMKHSLGSIREYFSQTGNKAEYLKKLKTLGVIYDTPYAGEMMDLLSDSNLERSLFDKRPFSNIKQTLDFAQKFYQYGDDFWKIMGFENEKALLIKHKGMAEVDAEIEAAERIRNTYPTYSMTGRFVQRLRRFPLAGTFVSFPAEIIRTSYHIMRYLKTDLKDTPALGRRKVAGFIIASGAIHAMQYIAKILMGMSDDEEEAFRDLAAPWQRNSNIIPLGYDKDGKVRLIDMSFLDPYNYWKRPINAMLRDQPFQDAAIDSAREMLSPFFGEDIAYGAISEVMNNKKASGGRVFNPNSPAIDQTADIADHIRKALQPGALANAERIIKAASGEVSASGRPYTMKDEMAALVGFRITTFDPKSSIYYKAFEFQDKKRDATSIFNSIARNPNEISDRQLTQAYQNAVETRIEAYEEMMRLIKAAMASGLTRSEAIRTLRNSGVSKADSLALVQGRIPAWKPSSQSMANAVKRADVLFDPKITARLKERQELIRKEFMAGGQ